MGGLGMNLIAGASGVMGRGRDEGGLTDVQSLQAQLWDSQHLCRACGCE